MGARGNNMFHIGELGGVLKTLLWEKGVDYISIPPTTMKLVITGKGNAGRGLKGAAKKQPIIDALRNQYGLVVNQHDEADAAGLMLIGEILCGARKLETHTGKSDRFDTVRKMQITKGKLQSISKPNS